MPRTPIRQDRERLVEEVKALRQRVQQLEEAQAAGSNPPAPIPAGNLPPTPPHPQAYPLGDPAFPYQRMVEELSEGLVALSPTHAIRYVNRRFASLLGRAPERLLDAHFFDLIAPEDRTRFETFLSDSTPPYIELHLIGAQGNPRPVEISTRDWVVNGIRTFLVVIDLSDRQRMQATLAETEAERRRIETSLQDSERYFERIFQLSPTAIVLSRLEDSIILDVNEKFLKLTGFAREQVIGASALALGLWVDPQERAGLKARLQDGLPVHHYEGHLHTHAGEVRDVLISADLIGRRGENVILALFDDITERKHLEELARRHTEQMRQHVADMQRYADEVRKHAEERQQHAVLLERLVRERTAELDAERARWQGVVEGIADEVWVCDPHGKMSLINLPDVTAMGLTEFTGKTIAEIYEQVDILTPDGQLRPLDQAPLLRSLKGEIVRGEEIMRHRQTGRTRYRQFSCAPTRDAAGQITGAVAIIRDITEHKRLEDRLRAGEQRLRRMVNVSRFGVLTFDVATGTLLDANDAFLEMTGYDRAQVNAHALTWQTMTPPEYGDVSRQQMEQLQATGHIGPYEKEYFRQDGSRSWMLFAGADVGDGTIVEYVVDISDRKQLQQALEQTSRRVQEILESIQDGFFALDREWRFTYVNQRAAQNVGTTPEALIGRNVWEAYPQLLGTRLERKYRSAMGERLPARFETAGVLTGTSYEIRVYPSADGLSVYWIDITERQRAETTLRKRETTLAQAGRMARLGAWDIEIRDPDHLDANPLTWSDEVYRIFGYTPGQVKASNDLFFERVHPDDRSRVRDAVARARATRQPYNIEHRIVRPDGVERIVHEVGEFSFDDQGQPVGLVGAVQDITDERLAEQAVQESEERLRAAAQAANIGIWNWNPKSGAVRVGGNWKKVFGIKAEADVTFDTWRNVLHPEDQETAVSALIAAKDNHTEYYAEYRVVWPDGTVRWIVDRGRASYDEQGHALHMAGVNVDITERKEMEDSLRQAMHRIQDLNENLGRRATELEIANRELDSFSYSVSHDLRTPLASIDVFSATLQDEYGAGLPEKAQRYLVMIRANTKQMDELISSLLSLSRLSRQSLQKQTVDMTTLVRDAAQTLENETRRTGVSIDIQNMGAAVADPVLLKQVWVNLLANALKFSRKRDEARIEIGCHACDGEERVYYVRDNGVGFDMSQADRLFGVFQRLHGEDDYEGTGVGLAIVQRIVRRHGGRIWAEGEVNQGATFFFTLP